MITKLLEWLSPLIDYNAARQRDEHKYLSESKDLADLERRQRQLMNSNFKFRV